MLKKILKHPLTILLSICAGVALGLFDKNISAALGMGSLAAQLAMLGQLYLFLIQMTVIPIIVTAIAGSLAKLIRSKSASGSLRRLTFVFIAAIAMVAVIGMATGYFGQPGLGMDENTKTTLGKIISKGSDAQQTGVLELSLGAAEEVVKKDTSSIFTFLTRMIPQNIFSSLTAGNTLEIVIFAILFGIALGFIKNKSADSLIALLGSLFEVFQTLINWSLYALPFGLIFLLSGQIASVGVEIFNAMLKFIVLFYGGGLVIFLVASVLIWIRTRERNPLKVLGALLDPIIISFATRSSLASLPSSITSLEDKLGFDSDSVNLTLPLGMTLGRFGNIFFFALASFFVVQLYGVSLGFAQYLMIFIGVIFAGTATAGASGIVTLSVINIVLSPLGLPIEAILVIFMAIDPIIDPMRTFLIVYVNILVSAFVAKRRQVLPGDRRNVWIVALPVADIKHHVQSGADGALDGLDVAIVRELAQRLGRQVEFVREDDDQDTIIEKLKSGQADIGAGRLLKRLEVGNNVAYSLPYGALAEGNSKKFLCLALRTETVPLADCERIMKELVAEKFIAGQLERIRKV